MRADRPTLAEALTEPECYPHPVEHVEKLETHISWVFLAGPYAYKVKKPVSLGFLDFSTLDARRACCEDELRLNRRFAPELYLDVVEIRGARESPRISGAGPVVEYALRMRRFPQEALASRMLARGALTPAHLGEFARYLARFHSSLPPAAPSSGYGAPAAVLGNAIQNFDQIAPLLADAEDRDALAALQSWTEREFRLRRGAFEERCAAGMVRECHGDLHLGNVVLLEDRLVPFDCIEFSAALRWNDVMSEVAFLAMDLHDRHAEALAWLFVGAYLEETGAYSSMAVLRFYMVYRAMVRAKVHLMRAQQEGLDAAERARLTQQYRQYVALAMRLAMLERRALVLMHGLSGSGKSTVAAALSGALGALRIRSDVERKRLGGMAPLSRSGSRLAADLYDARATSDTYARLGVAASSVLDAGYTAIIDAAFLRRSQRAGLRAVALEARAPVVLVDVGAPQHVLRSRISARRGDPSEATIEVLEHQLATMEGIGEDEGLAVVKADGTLGCTPQLVYEVERAAGSDKSRLEKTTSAARAGAQTP